MSWLVFSWLIALFSQPTKIADGPNLFDMTKSAYEYRNSEEKIMEPKNKVVVGKDIKSFCTHREELTDTVS